MSGERRDDLATKETAEHDEGFLTRWSERKSMARQGLEPPEPEENDGVPPEAEGAAGDPADAATAEVADAAAEPVELPPLESLDEDSDYSPFLAAGVPSDVRRDALRKLFHSPKFNVRDGLDDYDLDFTNPEPLGDIITAEMRHRMQVELERLARLDEENDEPDEADETIETDDEQPRAS
jgi:hypothetical protein